jgi:hypothetical protein
MAMHQAVRRFLGVSSVPVFAVALLLMAGTAFGQDRTEAHVRDSNPGERFAVPVESSPPPSPRPSAEPSPPPSEPADGSSGSSQPRTAVPTNPGDHHGPQRQPPTRHGHGAGETGTVYYAPYYPFGYFGFASDWYDDVYGNMPGPGGQGSSEGPAPRDERGALDLDISPGRTQVFLDGEKIGTVDNFDGWPRYLWLPQGTYQLVFYLDGYKTLVRNMTIVPGMVIDMDDHMQRGPSTRPEDLVSAPPG